MFVPSQPFPIYTNIPPPVIYSSINTPPVVAVFIGNITEKIEDSTMREILDKCGQILNWKRVQGASGKLQAFGLCEYDNPEATLRCIRLLNSLFIADKALIVKVDPKTDELLKEYLNKIQRSIDEKYDNVSKEEKKEKLLQFETKRANEDKSCVSEVEKILDNLDLQYRFHDNENKNIEPNQTCKILVESNCVENEKTTLISQEIEKLRNKRKNNETDDESHEQCKNKSKHKEKRRDYSERHKDSRRRSRSWSRHSRRQNNERKRRRDSRSPSPKKRRSDSKETQNSSKISKDSERVLDDYEIAMFQQLEKKLREKERTYQKRLQIWETREKKKAKQYENEKENALIEENEMAEESRRLQLFFEDYDDDKLDSKYYMDTELERRLNAKQTEELVDAKDRSKEIELIESTRRRLLKEDNPNVEMLILKMEQSMQEHLQKRMKSDFDNNLAISNEDNINYDLINNNSTNINVYEENNIELKCDDIVDSSGRNCDEPQNHCESTYENEYTKDIHVEIKKSPHTVTDENEYTEHIDVEMKKSPQIVEVSNETDENFSRSENKLDKSQIIKNIIDAIPKEKEELFSVPVDWQMINETFVDASIKPWVNKKIIEYIGEEEPSLSKFICDQLLDHKSPYQILEDVAMVLEEEADVFVVKMWRLLIYVIEEKKAGLDKLV